MIKVNDNLLSGLATFTTTATCHSFTQAAEKLHITTGAISQQIKLLEQNLQLTLFERHSRGIRLTPTGQQLHQIVEQSLTDIGDMISQLQQANRHAGDIHLKLTPSFAYKWLVPRLQDFYQQYPDIKIHTFAEGALVDHNDSNFDLAIDYGKTPYQSNDKKINAELLLAEQLLPVMSPQYMLKFDLSITDNAHNMIRFADPTLWQNMTLLHDAMPWQHADKDVEWQFWLQQMSLTSTTTKAMSKHGHYFNRTDMAMAAAGAGLGVALARCALFNNGLTAADLAKEGLASPFSPIDAQAGYYLIQHHHSPAIDCFKAWLKQQVSLQHREFDSGYTKNSYEL
ncbi:LysR family transcriptional regulator [Moritella sp. F3]|uniref:LysR family transcriptional regulator n=1 Tax=Moritella sp. F3 TaxID=2718882 RepID=UPI0018E13501|nr:LysR family transcriptional regulator [Moritella sp. F3]GIC75499.1 LysR family transcriptional regulator [Moritella sp. F1]GIC80644.1 LysR family transcriptional regulator [Moritella sp. F3]